MKTSIGFRFLGSFVAIAAIAALASLGSAQTAPKAAGHWEGTVKMGQQVVPITVDLTRNAAGAWIGTLGVPAAGATVDLPLSAITVTEKGVQFSAAVPAVAVFDATLSANADSLTGNATDDRGAAAFQLVRKGDARVNLPAASSALTKNFEGAWEGSIEAGGQTLHLTATFTAAADGTAKAMFVSVDQGGAEIPSTTVTIQDKYVTVDLRLAQATYRGVLEDQRPLSRLLSSLFASS